MEPHECKSSVWMGLKVVYIIGGRIIGRSEDTPGVVVQKGRLSDFNMYLSI